MGIPSLIPHTIPDTGMVAAPPPSVSVDPFSLYDIAIGGMGLVYANDVNNPIVRETVPPTKERIDDAKNPGEQTLSNWWITSQQSFHGGAGQVNLEPSIPTPTDQIRYQVSKNVDPFTPSKLVALNGTIQVSSITTSQLLSVTETAGAECLVVVDAGVPKKISNLFGSPATTTFTGAGVTGILSIATDGRYVYAANTTTLYRLDPTSMAAVVTVATYTGTNVVLGWVKARLMMAVDNKVYEVDTNGVGVALPSTYLRYTHPNASYIWRCFGVSQVAILAAGDLGGISSITQFAINMVSGAPVLQVTGEIAILPVGERVLAMQETMGTFLALGTTKGVRIGTFNTFTGALTYGPLTLTPDLPVIPANDLAVRDRFVYAAGLDYDEGGLICLDLGTTVDQAGRFAWAPSYICPALPGTPSIAATAVCTTAVTNRLAFAVPSTGIIVEGATLGSRAATLTTSRIRYDTVEPKLFKLGRVRGDLATGEIKVEAFPQSATSVPVLVGFVVGDPPEFRLPDGLNEYLQLTFTLLGTVTMTSYQVEALPGQRRQRHIQVVCSLFDDILSRNGTRIYSRGDSRAILATLEDIDAGGDETIFQEFTPFDVISTRVIIERLSYQQLARTTRTSDMGGELTVLMRTVES
jgi:hypothetical protein